MRGQTKQEKGSTSQDQLTIQKSREILFYLLSSNRAAFQVKKIYYSPYKNYFVSEVVLSNKIQINIWLYDTLQRYQALCNTSSSNNRKQIQNETAVIGQFKINVFDEGLKSRNKIWKFLNLKFMRKVNLKNFT
ncbi:hypothetical protein TTHERM_000104938 (macronuclear) [Tetrahymena thermophila SB210]|uniref:Uncharacterized protein n=1 Tax=Tetrahymena thermophila (strain SB210) TaxID=312017 RepID=W7XKZ7_TETTS|nr:hypothetical protein TTHERM_000104938 [Tetrahymena thermophila SB210]EWS75409.1 hypothetical protein TTHERM_000104938 [Tetrahymena thermophila SB210]|eukprot:XP_012652083.1 hypothetical protein TTHERM_000104938 [Tetrahymena thermophila SB210]